MRSLQARHGGLVAGAWLLLILALLTRTPARADGPHIAFHGTANGYAVTLFSAPDPLVAGPAELTLLVQDLDSGTMVPGPQARGQLTLAGGAPVAFTLAPDGTASSQLLLATVLLPRPGAYALHLQIAATGKPTAEFAGVLPVAENNGRRNTVLWSVFVPSVCVALFLANQSGKAQLARARARANV